MQHCISVQYIIYIIYLIMHIYIYNCMYLHTYLHYNYIYHVDIWVTILLLRCRLQRMQNYILCLTIFHHQLCFVLMQLNELLPGALSYRKVQTCRCTVVQKCTAVHMYSCTEVHSCTIVSQLCCSPGGRVTNAVGTICRKIFVGTRARPI